MSDHNDSFIVDDLEITPLEQDYKLVHPALGTVDGLAFIGVWYTCRVTREVKGERKTTLKDLLFLITSDRRKILANDAVLNGMGWRLQYKPTRFKNGWSLDSVKAYLNGADVDPISVLEGVVAAWKKYLEFADYRDYLYNALWDIGTYCHILFSAYAYAYHGGVKQTGKTKAMILSYLIAFNAINSGNMTTAAIFRLIQNARATLLLDESEKLNTKQMDTRLQEYRSILLSGYKRGGQAVYRVEKDEATGVLSVVPFDPYGPKRIANIAGLEDVLESRCKPTIHRRSVNDTIIKIDPDLENPEWPTLHGQLCILFLQYWKEIKTIYDSLKSSEVEGLDGREFELWKPIIALAKFFDAYNNNPQLSTLAAPSQDAQTSQATLCSLMVDLAKETAKQTTIENITETGESILLQVLLSMVKGDEYVSVKAMKDKMLEQFDEEPKWLTTSWIGRRLWQLRFRDKRRVGTGVQYKLNVADVQDIAQRMRVTPLPEKKKERPKGQTQKDQKTLDSSEGSEGSEASEGTGKVPSSEENLTAIHCKKYHIGSCSFPGDPNRVSSTDPCPKTCNDFTPWEQEPKKDNGLAKGAATILNGTSGRREP